MAEADDAGTDERGTGEAAGGNSRLVIIIAGVAVLLVLGGGGAYFLGARGGAGDAEAAKREVSKAELSRAGASDGSGEGRGARISLDPFVVNLADDGAQRYLKVSIMVEFFGEDPPWLFGARRPEIRDLLLTLLSSKYVADIRTIEGKQQLRDEITARISRVLDDDVVKAIYFAEFIVQ